MTVDIRNSFPYFRIFREIFQKGRFNIEPVHTPYRKPDNRQQHCNKPCAAPVKKEINFVRQSFSVHFYT